MPLCLSKKYADSVLYYANSGLKIDIKAKTSHNFIIVNTDKVRKIEISTETPLYFR